MEELGIDKVNKMVSSITPVRIVPGGVVYGGKNRFYVSNVVLQSVAGISEAQKVSSVKDRFFDDVSLSDDIPIAPISPAMESELTDKSDRQPLSYDFLGRPLFLRFSRRDLGTG